MPRTKRQPKTAAASVPDPAPAETNELWVIPAKDVQAEDTDWLWPHHIERHCVNILQGAKGAGKSTWLRALAAHITGGPALPGMKSRKRSPGNVIYFAGEENLNTRVKPGLVAAGADMARVLLADNHGTERAGCLRLPLDSERLIRLCKRFKAEAVFVDPIFSFISFGANIEGPTEPARFFMGELDRVCRTADTTILFSRNLKKDVTGGAVAAGRGSGEIGNQARAILHVQKLPDSEDCALAVAAVNSGEVPPALVYRIVGRKNSSVIEILGESGITADELVAGENGDLDRSMVERAKVLIKTMIPSERVDSRIIKEKAAAAMIGERTLQVAAKQLGRRIEHEGSRESTITYWLPPEGGWPV